VDADHAAAAGPQEALVLGDATGGTVGAVTARLPSMAFGLSWWSMIAVVPASSASRAPRRALARSMSRSRAVSRRHQICSRIPAKSCGVVAGAGMPRASAEYRWWWAHTNPGVSAAIGRTVPTAFLGRGGCRNLVSDVSLSPTKDSHDRKETTSCEEGCDS
jgi:hypothetical protein